MLIPGRSAERVACIQGAVMISLQKTLSAIYALSVLVLSIQPTSAQPVASSFSGVPAQVIPQAAEVGAPTFTTPTGSGSAFGLPGGATGTSSGDSGAGTTYSGGGGAPMNNMMSQSYGQTAYSTSQQIGINPDATAGIGQIESGFRNVPTSNGSSSATGPWQITSGTWNEFVSKYNLPYTAADRTNPAAQAVVAPYIIKDYSATVSNALGQPATVQQAYGAFLFGPGGGSKIAVADSSAPMSQYLSSTQLSNNNMVGWTVGQYNTAIAGRLGAVATSIVKGS